MARRETAQPAGQDELLSADAPPGIADAPAVSDAPAIADAGGAFSISSIRELATAALAKFHEEERQERTERENQQLKLRVAELSEKLTESELVSTALSEELRRSKATWDVQVRARVTFCVVLRGRTTPK
jgi:hypothetical protein